MSKQKNKGNSFEREVAKFLSKEHGLNFERVPNSGAFTGGKNAYRRSRMDKIQEHMFLGDIIVPSNWDFVIECKNYAKLTGGFEAILKGESKQLNKWLTEVRHDAKNSPHMLMFKISHKGTFFALPEFMIDPSRGEINYIQYTYAENIIYYIFALENYSKIKKAIEKNATEEA